jgi:hypothetical protein
MGGYGGLCKINIVSNQMNLKLETDQNITK